MTTTVGRTLRGVAARHHTALTVGASVAAAAVLAAVLAGHGHEFSTALAGASLWILLLATLLQLTALLARTEAWHGCVGAAGGTVARRVLYRAAGLGYAGTLVNAQLGMATRIAALRRSAPADAPPVSTLIAAEVPIVAVEALLGALTSFTLVGPLGLPWWLPIVAFAVVGALSTGLRRLALRSGRRLWRGLAILRSPAAGRRLLAFVLVAVFAQIARNWLLLHAVGVDASLFDAVAVLIAMVALSPALGPSVGTGAAVLVLGGNGVAAVAAAGVLSTVTGIAGGLCFTLWASADGILHRRAGARETTVRLTPATPVAAELSH